MAGSLLVLGVGSPGAGEMVLAFAVVLIWGWALVGCSEYSNYIQFIY